MTANMTTQTSSPARQPSTVEAATPIATGASSPMSAASPELSVNAAGLAAPWCVAMNAFTQTTMRLPKKQAIRTVDSVHTGVGNGRTNSEMQTAVPMTPTRMTVPRPNLLMNRGAMSAPTMPPAARAVPWKP